LRNHFLRVFLRAFREPFAHDGFDGRKEFLDLRRFLHVRIGPELEARLLLLLLAGRAENHYRRRLIRRQVAQFRQDLLAFEMRETQI
jgi:hypothetical protein